MKNSLIIYYIIIVFSIAGCSKNILISKYDNAATGHFMYGQIPERSFYYPFNLGDSIEFKWSTDTKGSYKNTSMSFYNDYMFVNDLAGSIYLFELTKGKELGKSKNKGAINAAPLIFSHFVVYVVEELKENYSTVYFYDFLNGEVINSYQFSGSCNNELLIQENNIYLLNDFGVLFKFDFQGTLLWELETQQMSQCTPAMSSSNIYFGNVIGELISVDSNLGTIKYRKNISSSIKSGISISDDKVYFGDDDGIIFCVDKENGNILWEFDTGIKIVSLPVLNGKDLFIGNMMGVIFSVNKNNGEFNWAVETGGIINTTPILFNDYLVQPDLHKKIHFLNIIDGEIEKQILVDSRVRMTPVFYKNMLYFGIDKGEILVYERREE